MKLALIEERIFKGLMWISTWIMVLVLGLIIAMVIARGAIYLSIQKLINDELAIHPGEIPGIANAILGSIYLAGLGTGLAFGFSLSIALFLAEFPGAIQLKRILRLSLDTLAGVPSIVWGFFGFLIFVIGFGLGISLLAGVLTLAILITPIMARAMEQAILEVPRELREASLALGATRLETALKVVLKQAAPGIITGLLISFGRAIGESAPLMFTSGFNPLIPSSMLEPGGSLSLGVYVYINDPATMDLAYLCGLVLMAITLLNAGMVRFMSKRGARYALK